MNRRRRGTPSATDAYDVYFAPLREALKGTEMEFEGPISNGDGTAVCRPHGREYCWTCQVDYSGLREDIQKAVVEEEQRKKREKAYKDQREQKSKSEGGSHECMSGCKVAAFLKCSACRFKYYCTPEHQKLDWTKHKAACKQLSHQWNLNCKLNAVLTGGFRLTHHRSGKDVTSDLENLVTEDLYTIEWERDGKKGKSTFPWIGYEPKSRLRYPDPQRIGANSRSSTDMTMIAAVWTLGKYAPGLTTGNVQSLANLRATDVVSHVREPSGEASFFGMAINYALFGTAFPWAPTKFYDISDRIDDEETAEQAKERIREEMEYRAQQIASGAIDKPSANVATGREMWDTAFARFKANRYDAECVWDGRPGGCLAKPHCPFFHVG